MIQPHTWPLGAIGHRRLIIDDQEGDGGYIGQSVNVTSGQTVATRLPISAISSGRVRWVIGGQNGTWRHIPGTHEENITSADGGYARLQIDPYTSLELDLDGLSVELI